jgi:hypothetical protein
MNSTFFSNSLHHKSFAKTWSSKAKLHTNLSQLVFVVVRQLTDTRQKQISLLFYTMDFVHRYRYLMPNGINYIQFL